MCDKRSLRGRNEGGRDQLDRYVRQDFPEDVINGRQREECKAGGCGGGGKVVGKSRTGRSRQRRDCVNQVSGRSWLGVF